MCDWNEPASKFTTQETSASRERVNFERPSKRFSTFAIIYLFVCLFMYSFILSFLQL